MAIVNPLSVARATAALKLIYVADALSMPVHWFYNPQDIPAAFPGGITKFEAAPASHPGSMMELPASNRINGKEIVGDVILKGKRELWLVPNQHYHTGMPAGENTLNAHCARLVTRILSANGGHYDREQFLDNYIALMTADEAQHPDTYAEYYHRGFFENLEKGIARDKCGVAAETTASVGGLVTVAPIAIAALLAGQPVSRVQGIIRQHVLLTHPDEQLAQVADAYVGLISALLLRDPADDAQTIIARVARESAQLDLTALRAPVADHDILGGRYQLNCSIAHSWPSLLFLAWKYHADPTAALLANTNAGGENCHRGSVLGVILGLVTANSLDRVFGKLAHEHVISDEIAHLVAAVASH